MFFTVWGRFCVFLQCIDALYSCPSFSACAICGVLCISLPIPIIVNNFQAFYCSQRSEVAARKRKIRIKDAKKLEYKKRLADLQLEHSDFEEEEDEEKEETSVLNRENSSLIKKA